MKAIVYTEFGAPEVLKLQEMEKPTPKENEVLVRVRAASVNYGDLLARNFKAVTPGQFNMPFLFWMMAKPSFGLRTPKTPVLGSEFAGDIEAAGKLVTKFKVGQAVFGYLGMSMGAYAEYICLPEDGVLALKPEKMSYEQAAVTPYGAIMALSLLRRANLQPGQNVLVIGASGGIGSAAVQIAKHAGAHVTGVCATPRLAYVRSLGAERAIDYTKEDFTQTGETYDLIFDVLGRSSWGRVKGLLKPGGLYLLASFKMKQLVQMLATSRGKGKKVLCAFAPGSVEDLQAVKALIDDGAIQALVDRSFPLEQAAAAHRYAESGQKQGSVVISF